jgi:hypothetical protein
MHLLSVLAITFGSPHWPAWIRALLSLHIICGAVGFLCAPVALATAKGGRTHRRWGMVYFYAMAGVAVTALIMSIALPIVFLALVAVFSFYSAFAAYRVLYLKDLPRGGKAKVIDWAAGIFTFTASLALGALGIVRPSLVNFGVITLGHRRVGLVAIVFGFIGMRIAYAAMKDFLTPPKEKMFWWYAHMQGMLASYIAAWTAFSAVNLSHWFGAAWWVWLWPTMVGVPAITIWTIYYKKKFAPERRDGLTVAA